MYYVEPVDAVFGSESKEFRWLAITDSGMWIREVLGEQIGHPQN